MSKQERASWASLIVEGFVVAYYFSRVFAMGPDADFASAEMLGLIIRVIVLAIVLGVASEIALTMLSRNTDQVAADERDALISAKAHRNGYIALSVGVALLIGQIVLTATVPGTAERGMPMTAFFTAHVLLVLMMAAGAVVYASRIFYYRRGW